MFRKRPTWLTGITLLACSAGMVAACGSASSSGGQGAAPAASAQPVSVLPSGVKLLSGKPGTPAPKPLAHQQTLTVGVPSKLELVAPLLLAQAMGQFKKENLNVTFVYDTVPDLLTLLGQDKIDLAYAGAQALVFNAVNTGVPIRWVSGVAQAEPDTGLFISTKIASSASTFHPADLKGKTIGVNPGGLAAPSDYGLYVAITKGGISPADVKQPTFSNPASIVQALDAGTIDGGVFGPPYNSALKPGTAFLAEPAYPDSIQIAGYFATTRLLGQRRAAGVAFFRALERTTNTYLTGNYHNNNKIMPVLAAQLGSTVTAVRATPPVVFNFSIPPASMTSLQQMYRSVPGTLQYTGTIKASQVVDLSLLVDAAEGK